MPENSTGTAERQAYQQHHRDEQYWTPAPIITAAEITFNETQPAPDPDFEPKYKGRFRKGHDPRRHRFTRDECSAGFWAAIESIISRYPNAIMPDGRHIACNFLKNRSPHNYDRARNRTPEVSIF